MKTILSVKGYKIPKKSVTDDHISLIKKDLVINPFAFNMMGNKEEDNSYNIYTESDKFYYVPRFWGIENFGPPKKYKSKFSLNFLYFDRALKIKCEFL